MWHLFVLRAIKLVDICMITTLYFLFACATSIFVDHYVMGRNDPSEENAKTKARLVLDLVIYASCFSVLMYTVRNLAELVPSPLNGLYGFQHSRVSELKTAGLFSIVFFWTQYKLQAKLKALYRRVTGQTHRDRGIR